MSVLSPNSAELGDHKGTLLQSGHTFSASGAAIDLLAKLCLAPEVLSEFNVQLGNCHEPHELSFSFLVRQPLGSSTLTHSQGRIILRQGDVKPQKERKQSVLLLNIDSGGRISEARTAE